jgi:hypothetical protein
MSNEIDVVGRIESLTHRKRVFVARDACAEIASEERHHNDEDLPVLTDVVEPENLAAQTPPRDLIEPLIDGLRHELSEVVRHQLAAEIPNLIQQATSQLAIELQQTITRRVESSLIEYLARRRQLALELPESDQAAI